MLVVLRVKDIPSGSPAGIIFLPHSPEGEQCTVLNSNRPFLIMNMWIAVRIFFF
jgi:hypothetical protein